jgi:hypothetical protein
MDENTYQEELTYVGKEPSVGTLISAYERTTSELSAFFDLCRTSYDDRRNFWPGKSRDLRKHGADAFPWEGASDMESHVIDERITRLVSLFVSSLARSNIRAFPVAVDDLAKAKVVSSFLKWMVMSGYIPRFQREMELGANYLLERGILITYVGWQREDRTFIQRLTLQQIAEIAPQVAEAIAQGFGEEDTIVLLKQFFPGVTDKKAKRAFKQLSKEGVTELPIVRREIDAPDVKTLSPDGDFFFPSYVTDPQRAPFCFWRTFYTPQELENKVVTDGWDEGFVDYVIQHYRGVSGDTIERDSSSTPTSNIAINDSTETAEELIEIIHGYQRLIDPDDGSEGIYETIFHRNFSSDVDVQPYAKFELLNGYEDYPVVVTRLSEDSKRLYDTPTIPYLLRGIQDQIKIERDSRIDRNSWATLPPLMHPKGQAPREYGPGRFIPYRRKGDIEFAPSPPAPTGSVEIENTLQEQADRLIGLDETPLGQVRKQFFVDKYLNHCAEVLRQAYRCFQRFGPDSVFFRVTGVSEQMVVEKGNPDENFDIIVTYDVLNSDPKTQEQKLSQMVSLTQLDRNGRINIDKLLELAASAIDPVLADGAINPAEEAAENIQKDVTDDIAKIYSGIELNARPNGAQAAMQIIQQYVQQPDVMQRLQQDEAFRNRLEKYSQQYTFQLQQAQNAEIGKIGTAPAQMGSVNTAPANA